MLFSQVIGQKKIKERLLASVRDNRISHAQLFLGPGGSGTLPLALAYAQYISCENKSGQDSCGVCISCKQFSKLIYPDLHFLYPQIIKKKEEDKSGRTAFLSNWREALQANPYLSLSDWYGQLDIENKQGAINVEDISELLHKLSLKSFGAGYKICILWFPEKMNGTAANKILKMLEEPPDKTLFIFVAENLDGLLPTIQSRLQLIKITRIPDEELFEYLADHLKIEYHRAKSIAHISEGDYNEARKMLEGETGTAEVKKVREWFLRCFEFQKSKSLKELLDWSDVIAKAGRENQKVFLTLALHCFRESFLISCGRQDLVRMEGEELMFVQKFSRLIHPGNCEAFANDLGKAHYHIERNAYPKALFLDLSFRLGRLLQMKP